MCWYGWLYNVHRLQGSSSWSIRINWISQLSDHPSPYLALLILGSLFKTGENLVIFPMYSCRHCFRQALHLMPDFFLFEFLIHWVSFSSLYLSLSQSALIRDTTGVTGDVTELYRIVFLHIPWVIKFSAKALFQNELICLSSAFQCLREVGIWVCIVSNWAIPLEGFTTLWKWRTVKGR